MTADQGRPTRVLQVVHAMNQGGVETWLMHVLRHMDRQRFQMDFLVHAGRKGAYDDEIRALGSRIISCPPPSQAPRYVQAVARVLRESPRYDVIHSHLYLFSGVVLGLAQVSGVPTRIAHIHPTVDLRKPSVPRLAYARAMHALLRRDATYLVASSQATMDSFRRASGADKLPGEVIYPAVDLAPFQRALDRQLIRRKYGLPPDVPVVLYVARYFPHKNHELFMEVAHALHTRGADAVFLMCGSHGPLLERIGRECGHAPYLRQFVGLEDISELMIASDVFLFPSTNEGFGMVAVEAQAAGLPVIATDLPAIREATAPEMRPCLFPAGDARRAEELVQRLLDDGEMRAQLGAAGRAWAQRFSVSRAVERFEAIYARWQPRHQ